MGIIKYVIKNIVIIYIFIRMIFIFIEFILYYKNVGYISVVVN